jgi:Cupin-like domain
MNSLAWPSLPEAAFQGARAWPRLSEPRVFRGLAASWPAVQHWSFEQLASVVPDQPVQLVIGNREHGNTQFLTSSLRSYLASLPALGLDAPAAVGLKEFDLLAAVPKLRDDVRHGELLPATALRSVRSWIGPAGARTGLHRDYLDNVAVQIVGTKRWWLVRPGLVERFHGVSTKYDAWAVLSRLSAQALRERAGGVSGVYSLDLHAGDVLYVPGGWWHEVENLAPSIMFGAFFASLPRMAAASAWVGMRHAAHQLGWFRHGDCTCHARPDAKPINTP